MSIILLVILSIIAIFYLVFRSYEYTKMLESFSNNTQSSLSTYYVNNVDSDDYGHGGENFIHDGTNNISTLNWKKQYDQYFKKYTNSYHQIITTTPNNRDVGWSGKWSYNINGKGNNSNVINGNIYQINDKIVISLSQMVHTNQSSVSNYNFSTLKITDDSTCAQNSFLGLGQLNKNRAGFFLTDIFCNNLPDPSDTTGSTYFYKNNMTGQLFMEDRDVVAFESITGIFPGKYSYPYIVIFTTNVHGSDPFANGYYFVLENKIKYEIDSETLPFSSEFILNGTNFVNPSSVLPTSEYIYEEDSICSDPTTSPCKSKTFGIGSGNYNQQPYNACAKTVYEEDGTCDDTTVQCIFSPNNLTDNNKNLPPACKRGNKITIREDINFNAIMQLAQVDGTKSVNLKICRHLNYVSNKSDYNFSILCYVSNLGDIRTLSYEYYGINTQQNNLSTQYDVMNKYLNSSFKPDGIDGLLTKYRNIISSGSINEETLNALSFTNVLENQGITWINQMLQQSVTDCKNNMTAFVKRTTNSTSLPMFWNINKNNHYNMLNSCVSYLTTADIYTSTVKNAEFNSDGTTGLSLYSGGIKQQVIMENAKVIKDITTNDNLSTKYSNKFYAITANLRTSSQLYLIPSNEKDGFTNNGSTLKLMQQPEMYGKWLILGMKITNTDDLFGNIKYVTDSLSNSYNESSNNNIPTLV